MALTRRLIELPWTTQPQQAELPKARRQCDALVNFGAGLSDAARGAAITSTVSGPAIASGEAGYSSTGSGYISLGQAGDYSAGDFWFLVRLTPTSLANAPVSVFKGVYASSGYYVQHETNGGISLYANTSKVSAPAGALPAGSLSTYLVNAKRGVAGATQIWVNGTNRTSGGGGAISPSASASALSLLAYNTGSNQLSGTVHAFACGPGYLSDAECEALTGISPWAELLEPQCIWVPVSAGGGVTATSQVSETDTAQAFTAAQSTAIAQAVETNLAQTLVAAQAATLAQASEVDTAQALTAAQAATIGQAQEADTAQAVSYAAPGSIAQASETDTAQPLQVNQALGIGQASEADSAQALTYFSGTVIGMALEIDTAGAFAVQQARSIGQAVETEAAQAFTVGGTGAGASAADVWSYVLSNGLTAEQTVVQTHSMLTALTSAMATCPADLTLALKLLRNKQITNQATGKMTVYDDDGSTVLVEGNLFEDAAGTTAYRGQGAERRERLA